MSLLRSTFLLLAVLLARPVFAEKRPNILFAFADDWGRIASAYAAVDGPGKLHDVVQTPTFDRIAQQGVLFRNAFVSAPSCTPCRSALMAGKHFWQTGSASILNGAVWDASLPAFPLLIRDSGYHIGKMFKVWSPGTPVDAPFGMAKHSYQSVRKGVQFSEEITKLTKSGVPLEVAKDRLYKEVVANFEAFLAARKPDQPFFFFFGPTNVHRTFVKGSGKALWNLDPERLKGKVPAFLPDIPEVREDLADYLGEVMAWDAMVGKLLEKLASTGDLQNTLVLMSGDHGPPGFTHGKCDLYDFGTAVSLAISGPGVKPGRIIDDFTMVQDIAPTLLAAAKVPTPAEMSAKDLTPLLQSDRNGQIDPQRDAAFYGRERHVAEARQGETSYPMRAIRTREHLLILNFKPDRFPMGDPPPGPLASAEELAAVTRLGYADMDASPTKAWLMLHAKQPAHQKYVDYAFAKRPAVELYDLKTDPEQLHNVAALPEHAATVKSLEKRLRDHLAATNDPRMHADGGFYEALPTKESGRLAPIKP